MKSDIHPQFYNTAKVTCACGNAFVTGSTLESLHTEICSNCHPFYTGKQKLIDTAGRVDKFKQRALTSTKLKAGKTAKKPRKERAKSAQGHELARAKPEHSALGSASGGK